MSKISVSVSNDNAVLKEFSEVPGKTMTELMAALGTMKSQTNDYLTELVEASKPKAKEGADSQGQSSASDENNTRPSVVVIPEKKAKV